MLTFEPTGDSRLKRGGTLYSYFEIYDPVIEGQIPTAVQIRMRIFDSRTGEVVGRSGYRLDRKEHGPALGELQGREIARAAFLVSKKRPL
jgi:hypothetical protein